MLDLLLPLHRHLYRPQDDLLGHIMANDSWTAFLVVLLKYCQRLLRSVKVK
jgi:hypothetical protein